MATIDPNEAVDRINSFFEKYEFDDKDKYFILKKMCEDTWEDVKNEDDDEEEELDEIEDDFALSDNYQQVEEEIEDPDELEKEIEKELELPVSPVPKKKVSVKPQPLPPELKAAVEEIENEVGNVEEIEAKKDKVLADANFLKQPKFPSQRKKSKV